MSEVDVMIDLETLATDEDTVVVSIGACTFDVKTGEVAKSSFYMILEMQDQLNRGRKLSADTLKWWIGQEEKAKQMFHEKAQSPLNVLNTLATWLRQVSPDSRNLKVWGNGSTFDISILQHMFRMYNMKCPWGYNGVMDVRTFRRFVANGEKIPNSGTAHNALDDSIAQANFVVKHARLQVPT